MATAALSRKERKLQTRAAIVDAAAVLFATQGIEGTSLDRIAGAIGLTKGAVYASFASKEELIEAVADARSVLIDLEPLFRPDLTLREGLRAIAREYLALRPRLTREIVCLDLELFLYAERHPHWARAELRALRADRREEAHRLQVAADERDEPLPMAAEEFFPALEAVLVGLAREQFRDPRALSDATVEHLVTGLADRSPSASVRSASLSHRASSDVRRPGGR
jgi:AcrR family transcriptional regulator